MLVHFVIYKLIALFFRFVAFAWLKCEGEIEDCEIFLRSHHILTRGGEHFGVSQKYVRISMLPRDELFDLFIERLSEIQS